MEQQNTYFIFNKSEKEEMQRLVAQDQLLTQALQETLPDGAHDVLDVACGTGGWIIEMARQYPTRQFVGIDINGKMVEYARQQAQSEGVDDRVTFYQMDALRPLEFAKESFDLVRIRLGMSFLRTWDWVKLLEEFQRITRQGGTVRIIESDFANNNNGALNQLVAWVVQAMYRAGHLFTEKDDGVTSALPEIFSRFGYKDVKSSQYAIKYTHEDTGFFEDMRHFYHMIIPFLRKWIHFPSDYEEVYKQAMQGIQQEGFEATWRLVAVEGRV